MFGLGEGINATAALGHDWWQGKQNTKQRDAELQQQQIGNQFDIDQLNRSNDWKKSLWEENNKYNTPSAQMTRFKEAGLNPHLIYGKGTSGNSASPASAGDPKAFNKRTIRNMGEGIKGFPSMANPFLTNAQTNNVNANTHVAEQNRNNLIEDEKKKIMDNARLREQVPNMTREEEIRMAKLEQEKIQSENKTFKEGTEADIIFKNSTEKIAQAQAETIKKNAEALTAVEIANLYQAGQEDAPWWVKSMSKDPQIEKDITKTLIGIGIGPKVAAGVISILKGLIGKKKP